MVRRSVKMAVPIKNNNVIIYSFLSIVLVGIIIATFLTTPKKLPVINKKQKILVSFDCGYGTNFINDTRRFAKQCGVKFTYFLSAPYFITKCEVDNYQHAGFSNNYGHVKFLKNQRYATNLIKATILSLGEAVAEGHEIASHGVGHFKGGQWSYDEWEYELKWFSKIIDSRLKAYNIDRSVKFGMKYIKGFRAPSLSVNSNMFRALKQMGYEYDASIVTLNNRPKIIEGLLSFPITGIILNGKYSLLCDYNFFDSQSGVVEQTDDAVCKKYEDEYYDYLMASLHTTNRAIFILNHGSQWNEGAYLKALKKFIKRTHNDYDFITFSQYTEEYNARR